MTPQQKKSGLVAAVSVAVILGGLLGGLYWLVRFIHWAWEG